MNIIVLDFETFFDSDYSLNKLTTEQYVRDPRFEVHGLGVRWSDGRLEWLPKPPAVDWSNTAVLCHHAAFDGLILSHHYGIKPARWLDTYSMAQFLFGPEQRKGLDALSKRFDLEPKTVPYDLMKGKRWADMPTYIREQVANGCLRDCELTWMIFQHMMKEFPPVELPLIDITIRMFTEPRLVGDKELLKQIYNEEILNKNELLYSLNVGEKELASSAKFKKLLESKGIDVAMKPGKNGLIPALAKSDAFITELLNHDDEQIAALAQARLDVKSTIEETRSSRLLSCANRGAIPIYLHYCGAHTRRWSGGDDSNPQNFKRQGRIRQALVAPEGYLVAAPDSSQIECRMLNWFAGQNDVVERFRLGHDPYIPMAEAIYGYPIVKGMSERQDGKVAELQAGYGAGAVSLARQAKRDEAFGERMKLAYRHTHPKVVDLWREADIVLRELAAGKCDRYWRFLEIRNHRLYHPNGSWLNYEGLRWEDGEWRLYGRNGSWRKMYGARLVQNLMEFLCRIVTGDAALRLRAMGYPVCGMAHDDIWLLVEDNGLDKTAEIVKTMSLTPDWAPGLPLGAECRAGKTYGG